MKSIKRTFIAPKESFFLFGPRGTGKSTYLRDNFPNAKLIDFLDPGTYRSFIGRPEILKEIVEGNSDKKIFILDEIQKIPEVLTVVHQLIETKKKVQFILTGSSSRKLKRTGVDLLGGRAELCRMHPFTAKELGSYFNLESALKFGLLPLVYDKSDPISSLRAYLGLYVKEEVFNEGLVRNIGNFSRFLEAVSFSHASILNTSNVARESGVERKTVEGYLSILEDLLLSFTIPIFSKKAKRDLISHKKFYLFDAGVFLEMRPKGPLDAPEEIAGVSLEGLVAQNLRAYLDYEKKSANLYYWRTRSGLEVDFVLYGKDIFWAIEVKNSNKIRTEDLKGLQQFLLDYPTCDAYLLYRGKERLKKDNILCLPIEDFLLEFLR
jgi:uncharacterized protein